MPSCHDMELGQIYTCEACGLELKVVHECEQHGSDPESAVCEPCEFVCCDGPLTLKEEEA